jgi:hypothetical protein
MCAAAIFIVDDDYNDKNDEKKLMQELKKAILFLPLMLYSIQAFIITYI